MATDRCVFIPFDRGQAADFIKDTQDAHNAGQNGAAHYGRKFSVVCYDDDGKPLEKLGAAFGIRILIAGHGLAGRPYISNSSGHGRKEYLPFNVVADRLIEKGLQKRYVGTISRDVCYSAVKNDRNPPFADLLARELRSRGYKLINVIGYYGAMGPVYEKLAGNHKFHHRVVDLDMEDGSVNTVKTKDAKERFTGIFKEVPKHLKGLKAHYDQCPAF